MDPAAADLLCPRPPATNLTGQWIWIPESARHDRRNSYAYFRRTFEAAGELTIHVAADSTYELHLDGALLERGATAAFHKPVARPLGADDDVFERRAITIEGGRRCSSR